MRCPYCNCGVIPAGYNYLSHTCQDCNGTGQANYSERLELSESIQEHKYEIEELIGHIEMIDEGDPDVESSCRDRISKDLSNKQVELSELEYELEQIGGEL